MAAAFCEDFVGGLFGVSMPFLAMRFGADSIHLGILGGSWALTYAFACPLSGFLADRVSRRMLIVISALGQCAIMFLIAHASALWQLYILAPIWALSLSMYWPSIFGWLGDSHYSSELGRATGAVNLGWSVGSMVGGLVSGMLFRVNPSLPYLAGMVPLLVICVLMGTAKEIRVGHAAGEEDGPVISTSKRKLISAWMGAFSICCLAGLLYMVFPKFGSDELGIDAALFGKLVFMAGLMRSFIFILGLRFGDRLQDWRYGVAAQMFAALMVGTIVFFTSINWLILVYISLGAGLGINYYRGLYTSLESASARGLKSAMHEGMLVAGDMTGSFGGGLLVFLLNDIRAPYLPLAGIAFLLGIGQVIIMIAGRSSRKKLVSKPAEEGNSLIIFGDAPNKVSEDNQPLR